MKNGTLETWRRRSALAIMVVLLGAFLMLAGCSSSPKSANSSDNNAASNNAPGSTQPDPGTASPPLDIILSDVLRFPEEDPSLKSVEVAENELRLSFDGQSTIPLAVGDVVAGATGSGYLRRIENLRTEGDVVVLVTSQASLTDVVQQGQIRLNIGENSTDSRIQELNLPVEFKHEVYEGSGIYVQGNVVLDVSAQFDMDIVDWQIQSADVLLYPTYQHRLNLVSDGGFATGGSDEIDLAKALPSIPFAFALGPLPVVGAMKVGLVAGVEATVLYRSDVSAESSVQATGRFGMTYRDGAWNSVREWQGSATTTGVLGDTATESATIRGFVKPRVTIEFYGIGGPEFHIERAVTLEVDYNATEDCARWEIEDSYSTSATLQASLSVPLLGEVFDVEHSLAETNEVDPLDKGTLGECQCQSIHGQQCCALEDYAQPCQYEGTFCALDNICRVGAIGDPCRDDSECSEDYVCASYGVCIAGVFGDKCSADAECVWGGNDCYDGYCQSNNTSSSLNLGRRCSTHDDCGGNRCFDEMCHSGRGSPCSGDEHCAANYYCAPAGLCLFGDLGDSCERNDQCRNGRCGAHGFCQSGTIGEPCNTGSECQSGICGTRGTCAGTCSVDGQHGC